MRKTVKVFIFSTYPESDRLEFRLIFDDGYEKYYALDEDQLQSFKGLSDFSIIQRMAEDYYESIGESFEDLKYIYF